MKSIILILTIAYGCLGDANGQTITTVAGNGIAGYSGDHGSAITASLHGPVGLTFDLKGNLLIGDVNNNCIRKVNASGIITTIAGTGVLGYTGDGGPATAAEMGGAFAVIVDSIGSIYYPDGTNGTIRKIDTFGVMHTVAGNGSGIYSGDGGPCTSAGLDNPEGVSIDKYGNMYIADAFTYRIRKINSMGVINTIAGTGIPGSSCATGPATAVALNMPARVIPDESGNLYFIDWNSCIRKIDHFGNITSIAGTGIPGYSGDDGPATAAQLYDPIGIAITSSGVIYFADFGNNRVRRIDAAGIITTVAGNGIGGFNGDGGPATAAQIDAPNRVVVDKNGDVLFTEAGGNRVRKIIYNLSVPSIEVSAGDVSVYPNPASEILNFEFPISTTATVKLMDLTGRIMDLQVIHNRSGASIKVIGYVPGIYLYQVTTDTETKAGKILIQ